MFRIASSIALLFLLWAFPAFAQISLVPTVSPAACDFISGQMSYDCIPMYIGYIVMFVLQFAGGFFLTGIIIGGYKWALLSASQQKQAGRQQIVGAIIGFAVVVFSYLLVDTVFHALT